MGSIENTGPDRGPAPTAHHVGSSDLLSPFTILWHHSAQLNVPHPSAGRVTDTTGLSQTQRVTSAGRVTDTTGGHESLR